MEHMHFKYCVFINFEAILSVKNKVKVKKQFDTLYYTYRIIGCGPLGQKVAKTALWWHPSREHLVCCLVERHIGTLSTKTFPREKLARY